MRRGFPFNPGRDPDLHADPDCVKFPSFALQHREQFGRFLAQDAGQRPGFDAELKRTVLGAGGANAVGERPRQVATNQPVEPFLPFVAGFPGGESRVAVEDAL